MLNTEFASWLAGFFLITSEVSLSESQRQCISNHAKLCEYTEQKVLTLTNHTLRHHLSELSDEQIRELALDQFQGIPVLQSHDIIYFLQGAFEIGDACYVPVDVITEQMRRNFHGLSPLLINLYCTCQESSDPHIDAGQLRKDLHGIFEHEIDPGYDYDPDKAHALHTGLNT